MDDEARVWASEHGVTYLVRGPEDHDRVVDLEIDGRRVWSFPVPADPAPPERRPPGAPGDRTRFQPWPSSLRPYLTGRFRVDLRTAGGAEPRLVGGTEARLGDGAGSPRLADQHGRPFVVNKWGRLAHSFADAGPGQLSALLDHMDEIRELLQQHLGNRVFITGGTLLGPMRADGALIEHDDDADLAYLSRRRHPADVAREGFELGCLLRSAGYQVLRLSAGHLQIHFDVDGVPDHHVDVFTGFHADGWWFQAFNVRARVAEEELLPPRPVVVEGREEPAPHRPEVKLEVLYGPGWRVPDPSFTFHVPPATADRITGWFADHNVDREPWEDHYLHPSGALDRPVDAPGQGFAGWVADRSPSDAPVLELGCGTGADARALAATGRQVHAVDYSRRAIALASAARPEEGSRAPTYRVLNLLDPRLVLRLGAELAAQDAPWTVAGRQLLNALEQRGRDNVFRLCGMLLRRGGVGLFDVVTGPERPAGTRFHPVELAGLLAEAERHGLAVEAGERVVEPVSWPDDPDIRQLELTRVVVCRNTDRRRSA